MNLDQIHIRNCRNCLVSNLFWYNISNSFNKNVTRFGILLKVPQIHFIALEIFIFEIRLFHIRGCSYVIISTVTVYTF